MSKRPDARAGPTAYAPLPRLHHLTMGMIYDMDVSGLRYALAHLLSDAGLACPQEGAMVKQATSRSGAVNYVVIAGSGAEAFVDAAICCATDRAKPSLSGTWVLSPQQALRLLEYAAAH